MIIPAVSDVAFKILGFPIYWYGIIMAFAMFLGLICANLLLNSKGFKEDLIIEYSPMIIILGIIGARLYFCLLNFSYYIKNVVEILNIREGGLSIHGAIIAGIITLVYISKKENINLFTLLDSVACSAILGQAIGRWGNYFNCEAYGIPTASQSWGLFIPPVYRMENYIDISLYHPAFLYESVLDIISFMILLFIYKKQKTSGIVFFSYLIIYSIIRYFVEQIRLDSALTLYSVHFPQIISVVLIIVGLCGLIKRLFVSSGNI